MPQFIAIHPGKASLFFGFFIAGAWLIQRESMIRSNPPGMGLEKTMPHPQSSVLKNHQRLPRVRKRPQPTKMEETLDGDRLLGLMEKYLRSGRHEQAAAVVEVAEGVELLFSSRPKRMRFTYLCEKERGRGRRGGAGVAA